MPVKLQNFPSGLPPLGDEVAAALNMLNFMKRPLPPPPPAPPPDVEWTFTTVLAALALVLLTGALISIIRRLKSTTLPFVKGLPFPAHLHVPFFGVAHLLGDAIEGTRLLSVNEADESGIVTFKLMGTNCISVLKAEHVRKVLLASNFRAQIPMLQKHMNNFLGPKALVQLMHEEWKLHRRMMTKSFHWQSLEGMVPDMVTVSNAFADLLILKGEGGEKIDIFQALKLATLDTIGLTAFGFAFNTVRDGAHPVASAFEYLLDETTRRQFVSPLSLSSIFTWLPTPSNRRFWKEVTVLRSTIDAIVAARSKDGATTSSSKYNDLLKYMLESKEASTLSAQALSDNLLTFLFGGFDTTSIALSYTLYLLARHPAEQRACAVEIASVLGKDGSITYESVAALKRCQAVISEALRLYPPAPVTVRTLESALDLDGHLFPAGTMAWVPIWWIQRSPLNWGDDANEFRPARFLDLPCGDGGDGADGSEMPLTSEGKRSGTSLLRTLAFSGGQRNCVGQRFAMIEATVMLAILVRDCEFKLPEGHPDPEAISSGVVQKPKAGIQLLVQKRGREL